MKKKRILYYISSVILIAAVIFTLEKTQKSTTIENNFIVYDTASVTKIYLADLKDNSVLLDRKEDGWYVNDKKAQPRNIETILTTFRRISIKYPMSKAAMESSLKRLSSNHVKVEIYQNKPLFNLFGWEAFKKERLIKVFYIGGPTTDNVGTLMKMEDEDQVYVTHIPGMRGYLTERFTTRESDYMSHNIFSYRIPDIKEVKVELIENPSASYKVVNQNNRNFDLIRLMGNKKIESYDTLKVLQMLNAFGNINYEHALDAMSDSKIDSILNTKAYKIITVTTSDGEKRKLELYHRENFGEIKDLDGTIFPYDVDRVYGFIDDIEHPVTIQFFTIDEVSYPLEHFLEIGNRNSGLQELKL